MTGKRTVILVEPEKPENTGLIARLAANFEFDLEIVNPDFNLSECRKTARKAQDKLRDAVIHQSLEEAVRDKKNVIGTKPDRGNSLVTTEKTEKVTIVVGRESSGLSNAELDLCNSTVHIETGSYSSLNQSHAAAVLMHHFF